MGAGTVTKPDVATAAKAVLWIDDHRMRFHEREVRRSLAGDFELKIVSGPRLALDYLGEEANRSQVALVLVDIFLPLEDCFDLRDVPRSTYVGIPLAIRIRKLLKGRVPIILWTHLNPVAIHDSAADLEMPIFHKDEWADPYKFAEMIQAGLRIPDYDGQIQYLIEQSLSPPGESARFKASSDSPERAQHLSPQKSPGMLSGQILEVREDVVICWVEVRSGLQIQTAFPVAAFDNLALEEMRCFIWDPKMESGAAGAVLPLPELPMTSADELRARYEEESRKFRQHVNRRSGKTAQE